MGSRKQEVTDPERPEFRLAEDLVIRWVKVAELKEQDVNAQVMSPRHFDRLTENVRGRGMVESLPYCHQPEGNGPLEIISGHHRSRAARAAGLEEIPVIVDLRPMRRSEVVAKQIAHNELHGTPDGDVLAQLVGMIDNVDDLLTTGLDETMLPTPDPDDTPLHLPHAEFDWRLVTMLFLPAQLADFQAALATIDSHTELLGVADRATFDEFAKQVHRYGWLHEVRNMATAIHLLTQIAARESDQAEADGVQPGGTWVRTGPLVGAQIPPDAAEVVAQAVSKACADHDLDPAQPWRALEVLAADYLAGL